MYNLDLYTKPSLYTNRPLYTGQEINDNGLFFIGYSRNHILWCKSFILIHVLSQKRDPSGKNLKSLLDDYSIYDLLKKARM